MPVVIPLSISGASGDKVGGVQTITPTVSGATAYGQNISLEGDSVPSHIGPAHPTSSQSATLVATWQPGVPAKVSINGIKVCRIGDIATCGDAIIISGLNLGAIAVGNA